MSLVSLNTWNPLADVSNTYDLVLAYISPESRSRFCSSKITPKGGVKLAIIEQIFNEDEVYKKNVGWFQKNNFRSIKLDDLEQSFSLWEKEVDRELVSVFIDISCMSRKVMAEVFSWLFFKRAASSLQLNVVYSLAKFTPPPKDIHPNESIETVHDTFSGWSPAQILPTSLVLGLGYEPFKAEGASEFFDPHQQWIFVPESNISNYLSEVERNNADLLARMNRDHRIVKYRLDDPESTFGQLEMVVSSLVEESNPVLLPFGPKLFFFLCLVQSYCHPEVGVWRVTGETNETPLDRKPSDCVIGCQLHLSRTVKDASPLDLI